MIYCKNCGKELGDDFYYCPECGEKINADLPIGDDKESFGTRICSRCGATMPADAFYCLNCGNPFDDADDDFIAVKKDISRNRKSRERGRKKWIALLLCIFFGWLGIHRFYEGKIVTGLIWLFTLGLLGIGWLIDIILTLALPSQLLWK